MKITKSQLERIIKEELEEELVERDSMRTQVDTGPTQAIEDDDPTRVEEPNADQDQMYGKTQVEDTAPTRVDPNTLGAKAAYRRWRNTTGQRYTLDRSVKTRTRALDADEADFNSLVDDANARINKNKTRAKRTSAMDRFRDLTGSMTSRFRGRGSRRRREESITKNELLRLIREELEEALEATRAAKTRAAKTRAPKTRVMEATKSNLQELIREELAKLK